MALETLSSKGIKDSLGMRNSGLWTSHSKHISYSYTRLLICLLGKRKKAYKMAEGMGTETTKQQARQSYL
eukprot:3763590-Amphidinium_carterae.1